MKFKKQLKYREHELIGAIWAINEIKHNPHIYVEPDIEYLEEWKMKLEERRKEILLILSD